MIKFRGQRVDNSKFVEGHYQEVEHMGVKVSFIDNGIGHVIYPETLQVLTTDGWADIADVEVVRKGAADVSGELPLNRTIYRNAQSMDYEKFCEWFNQKVGRQ